MLDLHPSVECRPVHLRYAKVRENQIVDVGAESFERGMPIGDRIDLAVPILSYRTGHEIAKERIVIHDKDAWTLEASRMDVTVRASVPWFAVRKGVLQIGQRSATINLSSARQTARLRGGYSSCWFLFSPPITRQINLL